MEDAKVPIIIAEEDMVAEIRKLVAEFPNLDEQQLEEIAFRRLYVEDGE